MVNWEEMEPVVEAKRACCTSIACEQPVPRHKGCTQGRPQQVSGHSMTLHQQLLAQAESEDIG